MSFIRGCLDQLHTGICLFGIHRLGLMFQRNWRIQFQDRLGDRDRREEEKHAQILLEAQAALEKTKSDYLAARQAKIQNQVR